MPAKDFFWIAPGIREWYMLNLISTYPGLQNNNFVYVSVYQLMTFKKGISYFSGRIKGIFHTPEYIWNQIVSFILPAN